MECRRVEEEERARGEREGEIRIGDEGLVDNGGKVFRAAGRGFQTVFRVACLSMIAACCQSVF